MSFEHRSELLSELEKLRGSRVLTYILSDRESFPTVPGLSVHIASEPQLNFVDQLRSIGKVEQLDLFLYTRGGSTDSVWPLVNLLRQHCNKLTVLVPFRAHSAGTLICLGANELVMTDWAELSPIDPTTGNQFNPQDPGNNSRRLPISVEDVSAFFNLSEQRAGIKTEAYKVEVLKELTRAVHPLALGNVQRVYMQIRQLANKLLALHNNGSMDEERVELIIKALTEDLYSHVHSISRDEAIKIMGNWVRPPSEKEAQIIWSLFDEYAKTLELRERFSLPDFMGDEAVKQLSVVGGFIESKEKSYYYHTMMNIIQRPNIPSNVKIQVPPGNNVPLVDGFTRSYEFSLQSMGWKTDSQGVK